MVLHQNAEESISADINSKAKLNANWMARPSGEEMHQVEELLEILARTDVYGGWCDAQLHRPLDLALQGEGEPCL